MFVGVTRQQGNGSLSHITVAYSGLGQGPRDGPFTLGGGRKLRSGKVFFFFAAEGGIFFFKLPLCKGVLFFSSFFNVMHYSRLLCTENMEVSQYVKLSHLSHFFVREMTHRGLKCVISRTKNDSVLHTDSL